MDGYSAVSAGSITDEVKIPEQKQNKLMENLRQKISANKSTDTEDEVFFEARLSSSATSTPAATYTAKTRKRK